jgi:hypothetical protein
MVVNGDRYWVGFDPEITSVTILEIRRPGKKPERTDTEPMKFPADIIPD